MGEDIKVGDQVVYVDPRGVEIPALVTAVHPGMNGILPGVNVVYVSGDPERRDNYGRQIERATSLVHESAQPAHGSFWRYPPA